MGDRSFRKLSVINADSYKDKGQRIQLEKWLEDILQSNFDQVFNGRYKLLSRQYEIKESDVLLGQIDLLAVNNSSGDLVVLELKKDESNFDVIGQISFYMGWVKLHSQDITREFSLNDGKKHDGVEGIIVCADVDIRLFYAVEGHGGMVTLYCYACDPISGLFSLGRWMRLGKTKSLTLGEADREQMDTLGKIMSMNKTC